MRLMRKKEEAIKKITKDDIRIVERAGTALEAILIRKDQWASERCKALDCRVCGEDGLSICKKRGIIYKHICLLCKAEGRKAIYWGQTSKSLGERAAQHNAQLTSKSMKSHSFLHLQEYHEEEAAKKTMDPSLWKWEIFTAPRTSFEWISMEAVQIKLSMRRRDEINLNGREEFGQYELPEIKMNGRGSDEEEMEEAEKMSRKKMDLLTAAEETILSRKRQEDSDAAERMRSKRLRIDTLSQSR